MFKILKKIIGTAQGRLLKKYGKIVSEVNRIEEEYQSLSDEAIRQKTEEFRKRFQEGESLDTLLPEAYAAVKNVCRRLQGTEVHVSGYDQKWDMIPFDVQILGAIALHRGCIAEMQTGEGKTLTAVMPLYLNALTGQSVHLVTVNDYLASRDCQWMRAIFERLSMTSSALTNDTPIEERKTIYAADIVYGTASEFGFDYLRDNSMAISKEHQVQRDHYFAIIDEVDSILIDEARTPLIISGPVPVSTQMYSELKGGVSEIVKMQRDLCNRLATGARKVVESEADAKVKEEAYRKLWLVSKGTPKHKVLKRLKEDPDKRAAIDKWDLYYYSDINKEEKAEALSELFIIIEEKSSEFELTDKGIQSWVKLSGEKADDFVMLDLSHEFIKIDEDPNLDREAKIKRRLEIQEADGKRKERAHNLRQLLRAHLMMERDIDYIIQEGKIVIIDDNTGRPQPGRRFADGLHQAIEAKENLSIQKETQTYATITLQNYFRMYEKIAGMTGTAMTEAHEFKQIYTLEVLEIPTHRPCIRDDQNDEIYMSEREKYHAILKDVKDIYAQGRPILIGTESVDVSEKLSRIFKQNQLPHTVLNAKNHEREAEIIANAGQKKAITIATNMAGRGTDIKLGQGIADLGGLYVIGSTRHQSRRIDRQLRGRCARQGDPGSSKFYISFEDPLLRLFASPRITSILQRFRPPEGEPISAGILNRSIETAQKRVEQRNFMIRKHTLEYDDVMNKQRQEIYSFRNEILHLNEVETLAMEMIEDLIDHTIPEYFYSRSSEEGWNPEGFREWLLHLFPINFEEGIFDDDHLELEEISQMAKERVFKAFQEKIERENAKFPALEGMVLPKNPAREVVRDLLLRKVDKYWQEHLLLMDHLRTEVSLRTVAQKDPLMEFKHEAFRTFDEMGANLRKDLAHDIFRFEMMPVPKDPVQELANHVQLETERSLAGEAFQTNQPNNAPKKPPKPEPIQVGPKVGRNDICPCGSGKKYKKCCGIHQQE